MNTANALFTCARRCIRLTILAAALSLVAVMVLTGVGLSGTAQAQSQRGAIPSLTLSSDEPGQLVITWETPDPEPTDYRLRWAHISPDFLSYTFPNEEQRGNVYPAGDQNTLTLDNLTPGDDYKVQLRARYYNADRSVHEWSGPWTDTATIRVKDHPPAAPTRLTAAQVSHDSVTLAWDNPQNTSINGYKVLRGPDAGSLYAIAEDTLSTRTEYTDATVAAETTYFYAVLALSTDGDGAPSTAVSATTPAAPQENQEPKQKDEQPRVVPRQNQENELLSTLTVNGVAVPAFFAATTNTIHHGVAPGTAQVTVAGTAQSSSANVTYSGTDADTGTGGHQVNLSDGTNSVTVTVTRGVNTRTYTLSINRGVATVRGWRADRDIDTLIKAGFSQAHGIWGDGGGLYVVNEAQSDNSPSAVYRVGSDNSATLAGNLDHAQDAPRGVWSDGTTMWIVDSDDRKLYAYTLATLARNSSADIPLHADNSAPDGVWGNSTTIWVSDSTWDKLYAYKRSDKTRDAAKDFNALDYNDLPAGIWSDGTTMWVADITYDALYAYKMSDKTRDSGRDIRTVHTGGNTAPAGIWSDGTTMWVSDSAHRKVFAYNMAPKVFFGADTYPVAEGGSQQITVTMSPAPSSAVTIPITKTNQEGATNGDYSGVPASVQFGANETSKAFTFTATQDTNIESVESVGLSFGQLPTDVAAGTPAQTTINIIDVETPTVRFDAATYTVDEGNSLTITVSLSPAVGRAVTIPITRTNRGGAANDLHNKDYSGVPDEVQFSANQTSRTFTFTTVQDTEVESGENVSLGFGTLPAGVLAGTHAETVVSITDDDTNHADINVGTLGVFWRQDLHPEADGNEMTLDSCAGTKSFFVIWSGPRDIHRADEWEAHFTGNAASSVRYTFSESLGTQGDYYEMNATVRMTGRTSLTMQVRGRFDSRWGQWSPKASLYCRE